MAVNRRRWWGDVGAQPVRDTGTAGADVALGSVDARFQRSPGGLPQPRRTRHAAGPRGDPLSVRAAQNHDGTPVTSPEPVEGNACLDPVSSRGPFSERSDPRAVRAVGLLDHRAMHTSSFLRKGQNLRKHSEQF